MQRAPIPLDEAERLAALYALRILDTPPEERYDRITRLAQSIFNVPIALISLIDENRQWFKSKQGYAVTESPRETSFCGHAIMNAGPMIVRDARADERFFDNPSVVNEPGIRFYAGQPLEAVDGARLGTLCIIDSMPRELSPDQIQALKDLAALVEDQMTLIEVTELHQEIEKRRAVEGALKESENRFRVIFDGAPMGMALVDPRRRIIESNPALQQMLGYDAADLAGMQLSEFSDSYSAQTAEQMSELIAGRRHDVHAETEFIRADDSVFAGTMTASLVRNALGEPHHLVVMLGQKAD